MSSLLFYLKLDGRISRRALWLAYVLPILGITTVIVIFDDMVGYGQNITILGEEASVGIFLLEILMVWPSFAVGARRFHDMNVTGWWVLTFLPFYLWYPKAQALVGQSIYLIVPVLIVLALGGLLGLAQLCVPGTIGENKYGPDPLERN